jgi:hypothetical protein
MAPALIADALALTLAVSLLLAGAMTAWATSNTVKRLGGVMVALIAAIVVLSVLGAPDEAVTVAVAIAFSYCALGAVLTVRLQEAYGATEAREIDAADDQDEPVEPQA